MELSIFILIVFVFCMFFIFIMQSYFVINTINKHLKINALVDEDPPENISENNESQREPERFFPPTQKINNLYNSKIPEPLYTPSDNSFGKFLNI